MPATACLCTRHTCAYDTDIHVILRAMHTVYIFPTWCASLNVSWVFLFFLNTLLNGIQQISKNQTTTTTEQENPNCQGQIIRLSAEVQQLGCLSEYNNILKVHFSQRPIKRGVCTSDGVPALPQHHLLFSGLLLRVLISFRVSASSALKPFLCSPASGPHRLLLKKWPDNTHLKLDHVVKITTLWGRQLGCLHPISKAGLNKNEKEQWSREEEDREGNLRATQEKKTLPRHLLTIYKATEGIPSTRAPGGARSCSSSIFKQKACWWILTLNEPRI